LSAYVINWALGTTNELGPLSEYEFPPRFHGLHCRDALETELKLAAIQCGYNKLHTSTSNDPTNDHFYHTQRAMQVNFACQCSRVFMRHA
jgi:hypothetical protein